MKFICPESQKRVSFKWGNIVSTLSSGGGSEGGSASLAPGAALTTWTGFVCCGADWSCACSAIAQKGAANPIVNHRARDNLPRGPVILKMNFNFIIAD